MVKSSIAQEQLVIQITEQVLQQLEEKKLLEIKKSVPYVPVSVSARHIHLQAEHIDYLFGEGYQLTRWREISQPGQFACKEQVTIVGPKGKIERVRILGPNRKQTQVEVAASDARKLGVDPPVRSSGKINGSAPITIIGPKESLYLEEGCIIADRHIHMTPEDAKRYHVQDKQQVSVLIGGKKGGIMNGVTIRVNNKYALDMHIDTDDANAFGLKGNEWLKILLEVRKDGYWQGN